MFCKLALRNVTRSMKDYMVYFLTLMFGVCLFYLFNSVDSQTAVIRLSDYQMQIVKSLMLSINYISVFISVVLGFLVIYANRFLMRRRKKELGVYMTLGMSRGKISVIIVFETFLVGVLSLAVGLAVGVFLSQGMSVLTAKLFEADMTSFRFVFSGHAMEKTLLDFGVIFLVVILFNTISVSKLKLIDLLTASQKGEKMRFRGLWVSVVAFLVSVLCLARAYILILHNGLQIDTSTPFNDFTVSILLGCAGTLLFFFSLSGFLLRVVKSNKKLYYKNLNMFVLRQFNSKIHTTYLSISVICLMLFITAVMLSTGAAVSSYISNQLKDTTPYDVSFQKYYEHSQTAQERIDIARQFQQDGIDLSDWGEDWTQIDGYDLSNPDGSSALQGSYTPVEVYGLKQDLPTNVTVIPLSQYNAAMRLQGAEEVQLGENEFLIHCNVEPILPLYESFLSGGGKLVYGGKTLTAAGTRILQTCYKTSYGLVDTGTVIVPDSFLVGLSLTPTVSDLNVQYKTGADEEALFQKLNATYGGTIQTNYLATANGPYNSCASRILEYQSSSGAKAIASYLTLYIGLVFLIAGAAVLALQQLSEASDNAERYGLLRRLGTEDRMLNRALFTQVGIYFLLPLLLAAVHSTVGISVVVGAFAGSGMDILWGIVATCAVFAAVYGTYFFATYFAARGMIRQK